MDSAIQLFKKRTLRALRGKEKLTAIAASVFVIGYIVFLLAANYRSQRNLYDSTLEQLNQEAEKHALNISHFYEERKHDLQNLSGNMALDAYFENKALGMSMEYGLSSSLMAVNTQFQRLREEKRVNGNPIYSRLCFVDHDGRLLVDTPQTISKPNQETIRHVSYTHRSRDVTIIPQPDGAKRLLILLSVSYFFKDSFTGQILAWVEPTAVTDYFMGTDQTAGQIILLICTEGYLPLSAEQKTVLTDDLIQKLLLVQKDAPRRLKMHSPHGQRAEMIAIGAPVQGTTFSLINLRPAAEVFGTASPHQLLLAMGLISLIVFGGATFICYTHIRTNVLKARIAESHKKEKEIGEKNLALSKEIIERMRTENALQESEKKYRSLVENLSDIIFSTGKEGRIAYINPSVKSILGYDPHEIIGNNLGSHVVAEDLREAKKMYRQVLGGHAVQREFRCLTKSGEMRWIHISTHPVYEEGKISGMRGIATDFTQTHLLQNQLIRSERLAATGQLAASIAHEINSPLQGIFALLGVIKSSYQQDLELQNNIDLMKCAMGGIRDTVRNLLDLNRPGKEKKQPIHVNRVIEDTVTLVRSHLKKSKVELNLRLAPDLPLIIASPQQLGQVLMNLINNATEAINGTLKRNIPRQDPTTRGKITIITLLQNRHVVIEISDNGPGISEADLEHIFDPFYTKKKTMGMGVGLSICHGIVEDHKGSIMIRNLPGNGAKFTIQLPLSGKIK